MISKKWLIKNKFISDKDYISQKELYKSKLNELSSI